MLRDRKGFFKPQVIEVVYPKAEIQKCIIHQIRNLSKYVYFKDIKGVMKDLKSVYRASTEELTFTNLAMFEDK
ncbi:transposase [Peptoniphilus indolicus]|uniref:transposase n=1 Tax=Peptoniphilus indolicus TaxID=33030 RepID=UPI00211B86FA|nr:transposase [Peptoniphilus indolicus]